MKQSSFKAICLILMTSIAVLSAFGDNLTPVIESKVLESFNNDGGASNQVWPGVPFEWRVEASKFTTVLDREDPNKTWPQRTYVDEWPATFYGQTPQRELQSFGIWGRFDRRGHNWVDIYPVRQENGEEVQGITIPWRLISIDMWVWGSNHRYDLEAYFRDYRGMVHIIQLGSINYTGWRNLRANIPAGIPQSEGYLPRLAALTFVKFRIWTQPTERVDNFFVYFNQFKLLVDTFEVPFDGDRLADPSQAQEKFRANNGGE